MARGKKKDTAPAPEATETTTAPQEGHSFIQRPFLSWAKGPFLPVTVTSVPCRKVPTTLSISAVPIGLSILGKDAGFTLLPVPANDHRGADTLDNPNVLTRFPYRVEVHGLAACLVNHFHCDIPLYSSSAT